MLTQKGFFALGRACRELADRHAQGRMVLTQEGGYNISYTAFCVHAVMEGVLKLPEPLLPDPLEGTYPDPPMRDPSNARVAALIERLKAERVEALAAARAKRA